MANLLTQEKIAAVLTALSGSDVTEEFARAVAAVAQFIIESEAEVLEALFGQNIDPSQVIDEWVSMIPRRISGISAVTLDKVSRILLESLTEGHTISEASDRLAELFDDMEGTRALLIARTEATGAANFAAWTIFKVVGVPLKRWMSVLDEKVRDSHQLAHGQIRAIDEPFIVGVDSLMFPGDSNGSAKEVVNCRCWIIPEFEVRTWTKFRLRAHSTAYILRMQEGEDRMLVAVRDQFAAQKIAALSALR